MRRGEVRKVREEWGSRSRRSEGRIGERKGSKRT